MLTRLIVRGFKNLVDVDVRFGPFTCIAGANGVGKSNLFDAIAFLAALADKPLLDAALSIRDETGRSGDIRSLFHRVGDDYADEIFFRAEMIVPLEGTDDLGQAATATITFLDYEVKLAYRRENGSRTLGRLELISEQLKHVPIGDAPAHLRFPHNAGQWRRSAVRGKLKGHRTAPFISADNEGPSTTIRIHQDGGSQGRPRSLLASSLPRTALSVINAAESPTATMARNEMRSWRLLQLEPSCLRSPDAFTAPARLGSDGDHLAATLYHLATGRGSAADPHHEAQVYAQVANRLSELIDDVRAVSIERNEQRELLTLYVTGRDGTMHPARALSDGTLRFLALAALEIDPEATGILCLEEPENGIHPARIPAMLRLLKDIATDVSCPVGADNPLRQVIINTHAPAVVAQVNEADLLIAELMDTVRGDGRRFNRLSFSCLANTWRAQAGDTQIAAPGAVLPYLNPAGAGSDRVSRRSRTCGEGKRVADREEFQFVLPFGA